MAGGLERPDGDADVGRITCLDLGGDFRLLDALDAKSALFHDAAHPDRDVRVFLQLDGFLGALGGDRTQVELVEGALVVIKEVKTPDLVRAVVGAVTGADAPVVSHDVEPLLVVHGGIDGADGLARSVFALHAGHRLGDGFGLFRFTGEVAIHPDPVHFAAFHHLIFADDGNVVFGGAGGDTRVATRAGGQIDDHGPLVFTVQLG